MLRGADGVIMPSVMGHNSREVSWSFMYIKILAKDFLLDSSKNIFCKGRF